MKILSWNIQSGKNCSGRIDLNQTLNHIVSLGEFDVICLQEVARHMQEYCSENQPDQVKLIQQALPEHTSTWGTGFSWPGESGRQEFGNLTLVKSELLDMKVHQLPKPAAPGTHQMQRVAVETIVQSAVGPLSIVNVHLAFHDQNERKLQVERLCLLEEERSQQFSRPKAQGIGAYQLLAMPASRVMCGDFNCDTSSPEYLHMCDRGWIDAWVLARGHEEHLPTCGIYDQNQWPQGAHCRDYFWLSNGQRDVKVDMTVDIKTDLSDHQPIILEIDH